MNDRLAKRLTKVGEGVERGEEGKKGNCEFVQQLVRNEQTLSENAQVENLSRGEL